MDARASDARRRGDSEFCAGEPIRSSGADQLRQLFWDHGQLSERHGSRKLSAADAAPLFGEPFALSPPATYPCVPCVLCTIPGNSLNFDPTGFSASASGAGGTDITDGQLKFTVVAKPGFGIGIDLPEPKLVT